MKNNTKIAMIIFIVFSLFLVGCGDTENDEVQDDEQSTKLTTVTLIESHVVQKLKPQEVVVSRETDNMVFLRSGVDATIEFYNDADVSKRLVIYGSNVDVLLRPNEHIEVKIKSTPQTLEYLFGNEYKQIIIA